MRPLDTLHATFLPKYVIEETTGAAVPIHNVNLLIASFRGPNLLSDGLGDELWRVMELGGQAANIEVPPLIHFNELNDLSSQSTTGDKQ